MSLSESGSHFRQSMWKRLQRPLLLCSQPFPVCLLYVLISLGFYGKFFSIVCFVSPSYIFMLAFPSLFLFSFHGFNWILFNWRQVGKPPPMTIDHAELDCESLASHSHTNYYVVNSILSIVLSDPTSRNEWV